MDQDHSRAQLIEELVQLRAMVTELRQEFATCRSDSQHLESALHDSDRKFKQAQEALRLSYERLQASEERFELATRGSGVGIWDWDIHSGKAYYSPRWKILFGYQEHEIGDNVEDWAQLLHPDERERIMKSQEDFLAGRSPTFTAEYRLRHKDGSYRWIIAHGFVVRDEQGTACRFVGSHRDITGRKRAEEALRQSEARYRALIECCPDAVAMTDLQGRILFTSERAVEQHGLLHPDDLIGRQATDLVVEGDRERFMANVRYLLAEGVQRNEQYTGIRMDGTTFDAEISSAVMRDAAGNPEALMGIYRDITERKRAEKRLRASDAELLAAAEIQACLLPQESPQLPGFDIAGRCYPAQAAAGDHFDFLPRPDGSLLVVMGDVSGHGIGPAIVAADFCARLRTLSEGSCELSEIAVKVNAGLYRETGGEIFVTAILGRLEPESRTFTCFNAGHPPAIVMNSLGEVITGLASGGLPFAVLPETPFAADDSVELADGDLILLYTDGLVEARPWGQPQFGIQRAIQIVQENLNRTALEIVEALHHAACQYAGTEKPQDDITVVVVKILARTSEWSPDLPPGDGLEVSPLALGDSDRRRDTLGSRHFSVEQCGEVTTVRFADTRYFDTDDYVQLQEDLLDVVERQQPHKLLVDLGNVEYCATALINVLLMVQNRVRARSGMVKLFGLQAVLLETLQCLNLAGTIFSVYADEMSARSAF